MINPQSDFLLIDNNYNYSLKFSDNSGAYSTYGLITKSRDYTIRFLFYTLHNSANHYYLCPILFTACRATTLSKLIELHRVVIMEISSAHAFYLGIELMKAELSFIIDHDYIQN